MFGLLRKSFSCACVLIMAAQCGRAELVVEVGDHVLLPDTPNQKIEIYLSGGDAIAGMNFMAQIEDGFPEVPGSLTDGPDIVDADLIGSVKSTLFSGNNLGQQNPGSGAQLLLRNVITASGTVVGEGLLVTLTIDTTGFTSGEFILALGNTAGGPTEFLRENASKIPALITDGRILIDEQGLEVSGKVHYYTNHAPVPDVQVVDVDSTTSVAQTDADGFYRFNPDPAENLRIRVSAADYDTTSIGVSTLDILLMRRHILDIAPLESPLPLLAGDVNGSKSISTLDIILVRRLILGLTDRYQEGAGIWGFIPTAHLASNPTDPWQISDILSLPGLSQNPMDRNFTAFKLGDVNNSWSPPDPAGLQSIHPPKPRRIFWIESRAVNMDEGKFRVRIRSSGIQNLTGLQWGLKWEADILNFRGIIRYGLPHMDEGHFNLEKVDQGKLSMAWDDDRLAGQNIPDQHVVLEMEFEIKNDWNRPTIVELDPISTPLELSLGMETNPATLLPGLFVPEERGHAGTFFSFKGGMACRDKVGRLKWMIPASSNLDVYLDVSTDLMHPDWQTLSIGQSTNGLVVFHIPETSDPSRFFRITRSERPSLPSF